MDALDRIDGKSLLVLGFDESCARCSGLADRLAEEVGDRLTLAPLDSPVMRRFRAAALGPEAPWAPTLVRITGDGEDGEVEAWVGWQIAPTLAKHLGLRKTAQVLGIIGNETLGTQGRKRTALLSRSAFLRAGVGAIAALAVLGKSQGAALARTDGSPQQLEPADQVEPEREELTGDELLRHATAHLQGPDASRVAGESLQVADGTVLAPSAVTAARLREFSDRTGHEAPADGALEVKGVRVTHGDGREEVAVITYAHKTSTLLHTRTATGPDGGTLTFAERLYGEDGDEPQLKLIARSVDGADPQPAFSGDDGVGVMSNCSGCGCPPGWTCRHWQNVCQSWGMSPECSLALAGCAECAFLCVPVVTWVLCGGCIALQCIQAVSACCTNWDTECVGCGSHT